MRGHLPRKRPAALARVAKSALVVGVAGLLGVAGAGCGTGRPNARPASAATPSGGGKARSQPHPAPARSYVKGDDDDFSEGLHDDNPTGNDDAPFLASYGHIARGADRRAVAALLAHYYSAAAQYDGASACALLYSGFAIALVESNEPPGVGQPAASSANACETVVSHLFEQERNRLAAEKPASMAVSEVRVKGDLGLARLRFASVPERQIVVQRENHVWRVAALLDSELP